MFEFANVPVAYLLWAVFGLFGGHRFYVGRWESGLVYMFTLGGCLVGWIIDGFILPQLVEDVRCLQLPVLRAWPAAPAPRLTPPPPPNAHPPLSLSLPNRSTTSECFSSRC